MTVPAVRTPFGLRGEPLQHLMLFAVIIPNFVAMGFAQSFFGGIVSYKSVYTLFEQVNTTTTTGSLKAHNSLIQGTVNACLNLGAVIGCLSCMFVGNRLGRRKTVVIGAAIEIIGTILFASAFAYAQLIIGRLLLGIGLGMMSATLPTWQAETSRTHKRGHHVIIDGIAIGSGIALASWINLGFSYISGDMQWKWRIPAMTTGILGLMVLCFTLLFPESPRWLALKGQNDQARIMLAAVLGEEPESDHINRVLANIIHTNDEAAESAPITALFTMGKEKMLYRILLACSVQWYSQMAGSGLITYYSTQLFTTIGLSSELSKILAACVLTFKAICATIPFATIEMAGRRRLFMLSGAGMALCMFCLTICASQVSRTVDAGYAGVVFVFLFVAFYPIGYLGVNFLFCQEIITTRYRAPAAGVSTSVHWFTSYVVSLTTPLGFTALGWKYYLIWGASAATIVPVVYFLYPETTDLSIEEIDQVFVDAPSVLSTPRLAEERRKEAKTRRRQVSVVEHFDESQKQDVQELD
ncbi:hypothetical protein JCM24511_06650 [Saitozyma sp. JCM 24511]|nr:hypothetical protein JCM24511_06650 [Saitozyma sp. JCM 24511]